MQVNGINISRYKNLIWSLVSRSTDPQLSTIIRHTSKNASNEQRVAILEGVQRYAEPCVRVLDFRVYFFEMCATFEHHGVTHYLDNKSVQIFKSLINKTGGQYTFGVYEELTNSAKRRAVKLQEENPEIAKKQNGLKARVLTLNRRQVGSIDSFLKASEEEELTSKVLMDSIDQRIHEEHFFNHHQSLTYTLAQSNLGYRPLCVHLTDENLDLWRYLQLNKSSCVVGRMLAREENQKILDQREKVTRFYFAKKILVDGNTEFVVLDFKKALELDKQGMDVSYFVKQRGVRLIRVDILTADYKEDVHAPSLLTSDTNVRLHSINKPVAQNISNVMAHCNRLLTIRDETHMLRDLNIFAANTDEPERKFTLPQYLQPFIIRTPSFDKKIYQAVVNPKDTRLEDRYECKTQCEVTVAKTKVRFATKTVNVSTKGLAIKGLESVPLEEGDDVLITLPKINEYFGTKVKKELYQVVSCDEGLLRLKISGNTIRHKGRRLLEAFINRNYSQLKANGKQEDILGLTQALRPVVSGYHMSIPFTYVQDRYSSFVETLIVNKLTQMGHISNEEDHKALRTLVSSKLFSDYISGLHKQLEDIKGPIYGYVLLLPRKSQDGEEPQFWLQDLVALEKETLGYDFLDKIKELGKPTALSIRLDKAKAVNDKYFIDELRHLQHKDPITASYLSTDEQDIVAIGEIHDITEIFMASIGEHGFTRQKQA